MAGLEYLLVQAMLNISPVIDHKRVWPLSSEVFRFTAIVARITSARPSVLQVCCIHSLHQLAKIFKNIF